MNSSTSFYLRSRLLETFDKEIDDYRSSVNTDDLLETEIHDVKVELLNKNDIKSEQQEGQYDCKTFQQQLKQQNDNSDDKKCNRMTKNVHKCDKCGKAFELKKYLTAHMFIHNNVKIFKCEKCSMHFKTMRGLSTHSELHSEDSDYGVLKCKKCDMHFKSMSGLWRHSETHSDTMYICKECGKTYKRKYSFLEHVKGHKESGEYVCDVCHKVFKMKKYLQTHMAVHCDLRAHKCKECGKMFSRPHELRNHKIVHNATGYKCDKCGQVFKKRKFFELHENIHGISTNHTCMQCDRRFGERTDFLEHMRFHDPSREYECDHCGKMFKWRKNFLEHMRIHTQSDDYECGLCEKMFKTKKSVIAHMFTHEKSQTHHCDVCSGESGKSDRCFSQYKIVHGDTVYKCNSCPMVFKQKKPKQRTRAFVIIPQSTNTNNETKHSPQRKVYQNTQEATTSPKSILQTSVQIEDSSVKGDRTRTVKSES